MPESLFKLLGAVAVLAYVHFLFWREERAVKAWFKGQHG